MKKTKVTVKDVAAAAQVTAQTVSRVFRNKGYISKKTRTTVLEAAKKLNYVPNNAAISLRTGKTKNIAVVFDSLINIYFAVMIDYLHREVHKYGYSLQTMFVNKTVIDEDIYRKSLSMGAIGVISFLEPEEGLGTMVKKCGVPIMIFGRSTEIPELNYITTNDRLGGRLAAERLLSDGCKIFAYVADGLGITCIDNRYKGFRDKLSEHGIEPLLVDCGEGLEKIFRRFQQEDRVPDGIFCSCDIVTFRMIEIVKKLGIKNTKFIGYDDLQADIDFPFRITTLGVDKAEYVAFAFKRFLIKIEAEDENRIAEEVDVTLRIGTTA